MVLKRFRSYLEGRGYYVSIILSGRPWHAESLKAQYLHRSCLACICSQLSQLMRKNQIAYHSCADEFFMSISSQLRLLRLPFWTIITILFVGCNKDLEQLLFFSKKTHRIRSSLYFTACMFNNRCISSAIYFTSLMKESMITVHVQHNINSTSARFLAAGVARVFFFHLISRSHFSHLNFTSCKLQNTRMLTDADLWQVRCSPIDSFTHKVKKTRDPK